MPTDIALLIASLAFLELGWYYSAAVLAVVMFLYIYFSYRDLLAQRTQLLRQIEDAVKKDSQAATISKEDK